MSTLKATSEWLRANTLSQGIGVDREHNVILGYVVAQEGVFKNADRGEFDEKSLRKIVSLMNKEPKGLKSRLSHPTLSNDGIGSYLGRLKNPRLDSVRVRRGDERKTILAVRGDLHFDQSAFETPNGNLADYVMTLAESDPDALSSSLVLKSDLEHRLDPKTKRPMLNADGNPLPPLWRPTALHASDVVDTGEAVDGLLSALSADGLPDELVRKGAALLDSAFPETSRDVLQARLQTWMDRYLEMRYGPTDSVADYGKAAEIAKELSEITRQPMTRSVAELHTIIARASQ